MLMRVQLCAILVLVGLIVLAVVLLLLCNRSIPPQPVINIQTNRKAGSTTSCSKRTILLTNTYGVFSFFLRILDWLACIEHSGCTHKYAVQVYWEDKGAYLNQPCNTGYNLFSNPNLWSQWFESGSLQACGPLDRVDRANVVCDYPAHCKSTFTDLSLTPGDLCINLGGSWMQKPELFSHADFPCWRRLYASVLQRHIRFAPAFVQRLELEKTKWRNHGRGSYWIGFHLRQPDHYNDTSTVEQQFLDQIMSDVRKAVDAAQRRRPGDLVNVYVATEYLPFLDRVKNEYGTQRVYARDIPRVTGVEDWDSAKKNVRRAVRGTSGEYFRRCCSVVALRSSRL